MKKLILIIAITLLGLSSCTNNIKKGVPNEPVITLGGFEMGVNVDTNIVLINIEGQLTGAKIGFVFTSNDAILDSQYYVLVNTIETKYKVKMNLVKSGYITIHSGLADSIRYETTIINGELLLTIAYETNPL